MQKNIEICKTRKKDIPYIEEKLQKYLLDAEGIDWQQFFVAKDNEKVIAFGRVIDHGDCFEIASLGVDYYHRKKGVGKKMFLFLLKEALRRKGTKPIYIVTHLPEYFGKFGFKDAPAYPDHMGYKRSNKCRLDESKIKIMKYVEKTSRP